MLENGNQEIKDTVKCYNVHADDFYSVHVWMHEKLGLGGLEEKVFAVVYGFSRAKGAGSYHGSQRYLSKITGSTRDNICRTLKSLTDKKLLIKNEVYKNNNKYCLYTINFDTVKYLRNNKDVVERTQGVVLKEQLGVVERTRGVVLKEQLGVVERTHNNILINIDSIVDSSDSVSNNFETIDTKEYHHFEVELINFAQTCGKLTTSLIQCLQGNPQVRLEKENKVKQAFIHRNFVWQESIENAKTYAKNSTKDVRFLFNNFTERLIQNLNHGDGQAIAVYKNQATLKLEKEKELSRAKKIKEREQAEEREQADMINRDFENYKKSGGSLNYEDWLEEKDRQTTEYIANLKQRFETGYIGA